MRYSYLPRAPGAPVPRPSVAATKITAPARRKPPRLLAPVSPPYFLRSKARRRNNLVSEIMSTSGAVPPPIPPTSSPPRLGFQPHQAPLSLLHRGPDFPHLAAFTAAADVHDPCGISDGIHQCHPRHSEPDGPAELSDDQHGAAPDGH